MSWGLWPVKNYHQSRWVWGGGGVDDGQLIFSEVHEDRVCKIGSQLLAPWLPSNVFAGVCAERQLPGSQQFTSNFITADIFFLGGGGWVSRM